MPYELSFRASDFPTDWNDDVRMNFLFSTFRERTVNPEGYDAKMNFWTTTIQELCIKSQCPVISQITLGSALERKHRQPLCLDVVLENMVRQGLVVNLSDFNAIEQEKGWIGWGFNVLVQKPVVWGFSSVTSLLNWSKKDESFVVLSVVKDLASKVLKRYYDLVDTKWTDNAVFLEHFKQECKDICSDSNFQLAIIQLQREKKAYVFEEYGEKVIKFCKLQEKKVEPLSELDKGVLSLNRARDSITDDVDALEQKILSCNETIKDLLKRGLKTKAMLTLKEKKRFEIVLKKKSIALDNIENLLYQLKNAGSEKMVLEAYRTGAIAIKRTTSGELDLDNIDEIMADVKEAMDDYSEVQSTISKSVSDESLDEFESELESLLSEEKKEQKATAVKRKESLPEVSEEEIMKRLSALRAPPEENLANAHIKPRKKLQEDAVYN